VGIMPNMSMTPDFMQNFSVWGVCQLFGCSRAGDDRRAGWLDYSDVFIYCQYGVFIPSPFVV